MDFQESPYLVHKYVQDNENRFCPLYRGRKHPPKMEGSMDIENVAAILKESAENSDGKYIPWWEDDFLRAEYEDYLQSIHQ